MRKLHYTYLFFLLLSVFACNKEQRYSNKLIKGEIWEVKDISVDGNGIGQFGTWKVLSDGSIYDGVPKISWNASSGSTFFEWQFQDNGKSFQLNYLQLCEECDGDDLSELDYLGYKLTGAYEVIRHGKNKMEFISSQSLGFSPQPVRISIERIK